MLTLRGWLGREECRKGSSGLRHGSGLRSSGDDGDDEAAASDDTRIRPPASRTWTSTPPQPRPTLQLIRHWDKTGGGGTAWPNHPPPQVLGPAASVEPCRAAGGVQIELALGVGWQAGVEVRLRITAPTRLTSFPVGVVPEPPHES
jgi:hypothetical protein